MTTRTVVGEIAKADGSPWASVPVLFYLSPGSYTATSQYAESVIETYTSHLGNIEVPLWTNDPGDDLNSYTCVLPDGESFIFYIPPGTTPIELSLLRLLGITPMSPQYSTLIQYVDDLVASTVSSSPAISNITKLQTQNYLAGTALSALRAIALDPASGNIIYASSDIPNHAISTLGILPTAVIQGSYVSAVTEGLMQDNFWDWTPGLPIFLGLNGALTQNVPQAGFIKQLAIALTPNQINVNIQEATFIYAE